jgi:hypothetical protein
MQQFIRSSFDNGQLINLSQIADFEVEHGYINATRTNGEEVCLFQLKDEELNGMEERDFAIWKNVQVRFFSLLADGAPLIDLSQIEESARAMFREVSA